MNTLKILTNTVQPRGAFAKPILSGPGMQEEKGDDRDASTGSGVSHRTSENATYIQRASVLRNKLTIHELRR
jgi:hypothetical protein